MPLSPSVYENYYSDYEDYYYQQLRFAIVDHIGRIHYSLNGTQKANNLQKALALIDDNFLKESLGNRANKYAYYRGAFEKTLLPLFKERRHFKQRTEVPKSYSAVKALFTNIDQALKQDSFQNDYAAGLAPDHQFPITLPLAGMVTAAKEAVNKYNSAKKPVYFSAENFQKAIEPYGKVNTQTKKSFAQALMPGLLFADPYLFSDKLHVGYTNGIVEFSCHDQLAFTQRLHYGAKPSATAFTTIALFTDSFKGAKDYPLAWYWDESFTTELAALTEQALKSKDMLLKADKEKGLNPPKEQLTEKQCRFYNNPKYQKSDNYLAELPSRVQAVKNLASALTLWRIYKSAPTEEERMNQWTELFKNNPEFKLTWVTMSNGCKEPTSSTLRTFMAHEHLTPRDRVALVNGLIEAAGKGQLPNQRLTWQVVNEACEQYIQKKISKKILFGVKQN